MEKQRELRQQTNPAQNVQGLWTTTKDDMRDGKTGGEARQNPPELFGAMMTGNFP